VKEGKDEICLELEQLSALAKEEKIGIFTGKINIRLFRKCYIKKYTYVVI
jgi:hypothetical protein